jgi:predicted nucleic acid-binding Zn ribbon protein
MRLDSLFDIIKKAQEKHRGFSTRLAEAEALGRWDIAVGELIAKHARAIRVQNSVLWVSVEHPIWRSELHYRKQQILDILNGKTPCSKKGLSPPTEILKDIYYIDPNASASRGPRNFQKPKA